MLNVDQQVNFRVLLLSLRRLPLFAGVVDADLEHLAEKSITRHYNTGEIILREGDIQRSLMLILEGRVKVFKQTSCGRFIALDIMGRGEMIGDIAVFANKPCEISAEVMERVMVMVIDKEDFLAILHKHPNVAVYILSTIAQRARAMEESITDMLAYGVTNRVVKVLRMLNQEFGNKLPMTHQDIADMAGTTRETASRTLERMKDAGILSYNRSDRIILLDTANLEGFR